MEKTLKSKKLLALTKGIASFTGILLVLFIAFSCNNVLVKGGGSLIIATPGARAASASSYTIELKGSNGTTQSKPLTSGTTVQFDDLAPDTYDIIVKGMDASGAVVFYGTSSATVEAGERASADVDLMKGVSDSEGLVEAIAAGGTVYIFESIDVESGLIVGTTVEILPVYQDVTLTNKSSENLFTVDTNGNLTIGGGEYTITLDGNQVSQSIIQISDSTSTVTLASNGIITNATASSVNMPKGGTFNMTGGSITGNSSISASAVDLVNGTFSMTGGVITGNRGNGVLLATNSTFEMSSGSITGNFNGVNGSTGSQFTMTGGSISGHTDGGVRIDDSDSLFIMKGGKITGNTGYGVSVGLCEFVMEGGSIEGNSSNFQNPSGGGVYVQGSFTMKGGRIAGNIANTGGGVSISSSGQFIMEGGLIEGNTAESLLGSGVYFGSGSGGDFTMSGSAVVAPDNDVYLNTSRIITVSDVLKGDAPVATITPKEYTEGTQVLSAESGVDLAVMVEKFAVTPDTDGKKWTIDSSGNLQQVQ